MHSLRLVFVAEFLEPLSPDCLGILYQSTSVGLRYGFTFTHHEFFLERKMDFYSPLISRGIAFAAQLNTPTDFPIRTASQLRPQH